MIEDDERTDDMTDRKAALQALLDAVESGDPNAVATEIRKPQALRPDLCWKAASGSINAAKALHIAMLPGWGANMTLLQNMEWIAQVVNPQGEKWPKWTPYPSSGCDDTNPASAWLCAILEALIAEADND